MAEREIIYSVTLPDGRIVTSPSGFGEDSPALPVQPGLVFDVTLEDGTRVTNPSGFPHRPIAMVGISDPIDIMREVLDIPEPHQ